MLQNFFKIAIRNLVRHKSLSFINIVSLALGLTACFLIGLFVWDEKQYDKFLPEGERIYRVYNKHTDKEGTENMAVTAPMYASVLGLDFPEVEQAARVMMTARYKRLFEAGGNKLYEESGLYVDSTFLEIFPLSLKFGSLVNALNDPLSIVISEDMSKRFFGNGNPVGKPMKMNNSMLQVKAVFKSNPKFHLQFHFLVPLATVGLPPERMKSWGWQQFFTYVKLKKGSDVSALDSKFKNDVKKKAPTSDDGEKYKYIPFFQSLKDIHLYSSDFKFDIAQRGNIGYVNALSIIAVFIIFIGCFNFVNLATARSMQRAKEVGVRKAIGADRKRLIFQFIGETIFLTFISVFCSVALAVLCLPWLNEFTNKQISMSLFLEPVVISLIIALTFTVGILAGIYPALVLSGFKPIKVLKGTASGAEDAGKIPWVRHGLVVVQFSLAVLLLICSIIVFQQVNYMHNKDLGFSKDQIMFFPMRSDYMTENHESFKDQLMQSAGISAVSIGYGFPGDAVAGDEIIVPGKAEQKKYPATQLTVDHDYVKTLGLQLIAGRDFSREMKTDADHAFIINEKAVLDLGFETPEKAIGQDLVWHPWGAANPDSLKTGKIIGVVKNFHYKSLYDKIETAVIHIFPDAAWKVAVKMKTADVKNSIDHVKKVWNRFNAQEPIEYRFLDDSFEEMYVSEDKLRSLLGIFTAIAVFVGCLGLFGLAAYSAERRKKEVGIRKVLGASVKGMVLLLSKDFIKLVVLSLLIASPVSWYFMNQWLQDFAYRIDISWWIFVVAGITAIGIAFVTVGFQALRSASANPIKSLRTE